MVAHNTGSTVTCSRIKLAYYNLKLYELEIYDLIVAKVALKVYRYRYRHRGKSLFTYRLLTELKIPLPYISDRFGPYKIVYLKCRKSFPPTLLPEVDRCNDPVGSMKL